MKYYNMYDRRKDHEMYFLNVLDNDIFLAINDNQTYNSSQSDAFKENPELAKLCSYSVDTEDLPDFVYTLWCCLSTELKLKVYTILMNSF
jgi:hypothetical protein